MRLFQHQRRDAIAIEVTNGIRPVNKLQIDAISPHFYINDLALIEPGIYRQNFYFRKWDLFQNGF
jgi:hypothetical protein